MDTEKSLVTALSKGDQSAFEKLYVMYSNSIYAYGLSLLRSRPHAEEIVQNVFIKIWTQREKLDGTLSFRSYLFTMARNMCFDVLKRADKEIRLREEVFYLSQKIYEPSGNNKEVEVEKAKQELMGLLPPKRRRIFEMSRNEGKSYVEIAQELGISISTVRNQMGKSLGTIRSFLSGGRSSVGNGQE